MQASLRVHYYFSVSIVHNAVCKRLVEASTRISRGNNFSVPLFVSSTGMQIHVRFLVEITPRFTSAASTKNATNTKMRGRMTPRDHLNLFFNCKMPIQLSAFTILSITLSTAMKMTRVAAFQELFVVRHGQATHNPRAEAAKQAGCSFDEFLEWMRLDDSHDSPLTELGRAQGSSVAERYTHLLSSVEVVISSPLSRCLDTANLVAPSSTTATATRVVHENFREINGKLLNAKRRDRSELECLYPEWSFEDLKSNHDDSWMPNELESVESCQQRGLAGFKWLTTLPVKSLLLVCHGGILHYTLSHENILLCDQRQRATDRHVDARFENCELRRYHLSVPEDNNTNLMLAEVDLDFFSNNSITK